MSRKCPLCGKTYPQPPALSRKDNKTEICPRCGIREALEVFGVREEDMEEIMAKVPE